MSELLTEREYQLQQWENGQALFHLTTSPGWEVLLTTLKDMEEDAVGAAMDENPADRDRVLVAHATAFGVRSTIRTLLEGVDVAIATFRTLPLAELSKDPHPDQDSFTF